MNSGGMDWQMDSGKGGLDELRMDRLIKERWMNYGWREGWMNSGGMDEARIEVGMDELRRGG